MLGGRSQNTNWNKHSTQCGNFWAIVVRFSFKEIKFGDYKIPRNDQWYSKLHLVRVDHLIRNAHKEELQFLDIKLAKVSMVEMPSKYLDNWNPISQRFFSPRVYFCIIFQTAQYKQLEPQTACKLISVSSKEIAWSWRSLSKGFPDIFHRTPKGINSLQEQHSFTEATPVPIGTGHLSQFQVK